MPTEEALDDQVPTPRTPRAEAQAIPAEDDDDLEDVEISDNNMSEENDVDDNNVVIWLDEACY